MANEDKSITFDPEAVQEPADAQLQSLEQFGLGDLDPNKLATPEIVKLLIQNQRISILQYKSAKKKLDEVEQEKEDLVNLRESLRVKLAKKETVNSLIWLEIPISILSGFSINMLVSDYTEGLAWFLLILSLVMLVIIRIGNFKSDKENE